MKRIRGLLAGLLLALLYPLFAVGVLLRRLVRGPRRPAWSWRQEATIRFVRWIAGRLFRGGIPRMKQLVDSLPAPLGPLRRRVTVSAVDAGGVPAEWIEPRSEGGHATLYYLHGGGYLFCSMATHRHLVARLALRSRARALGINYRRGPEHPFPAAVEDAVSGYRWLIRTVDPGRVVIAGDSAGGGLTLATLLALRDRGEPLPAGAALISPWVDLAATDPSLTDNAELDYLGGDPRFLRESATLYLGGADPRTALASPVHGDLSGLPPLLIQVGGLEMLHDQVERLARRAREHGVETELDVWPDMVHVWHAWGNLFGRQAREAIGRIAAFVAARTHGPG